MLVETGRVVAVDPQGLWVETIRQSTCGTCAAQKGCGHGLLNRYTDGKRGYIRVLPGAAGTGGCEVDDQVRISIPEEVILRGSLVVYMLPLFTMLGAAALGAKLSATSPDSYAMLGAVLGFGLGFALVRWHAWRHRHDTTMQPTLLGVVSASGQAVKPG
jgi:sigma-E factor negative regulatory protein RseC